MTKLCLGLVLALVANGIAQAQADDRPTFTVGTAKASRGQTAMGAIEVPAGSDAALSIPVAVIHGRTRGPVLGLVAGSHGTEYASVLALQRLIGVVDPAQIAGTVIVVPLVNVPSWTKVVPHLNPVDGKNMIRMYPGRADGTVEAGHSGTVAPEDVAVLVDGTLGVMRRDTVATIGVVGKAP